MGKRSMDTMRMQAGRWHCIRASGGRWKRTSLLSCKARFREATRAPCGGRSALRPAGGACPSTIIHQRTRTPAAQGGRRAERPHARDTSKFVESCCLNLCFPGSCLILLTIFLPVTNNQPRNHQLINNYLLYVWSLG